ncbi:MAG: ECF transporter S component [Catenisphaera adipataccumulans]|jgi:uncharacterized membrane protein|uniref:ECF transporter S component n=1 Tax=Catenisphaera adipataccumulans TaxID=700500 RepID=UPI003D8B4229
MTETRKITLTALGIALVAAATLVIRIPNSVNGYVNVGDTMIFVFAAIVDPFAAFLIGGIGSAMADVIGGYSYYAIFTLLVKGIEGLLACVLFQKLKKAWAAYIIAGGWMIVGYFFADWMVNQSAAMALVAVPGNFVQAAASIILGCLLTPLFIRLKQEHHV